ncbi:GtrA family protein [Paenibacillus sp. G2S3]|uniref:GtrA family protein n=1 Tax=Paenibacillus sp. G2S3 TaxID=3047872 RepID=UPI0024C0F1F4|nr:GtrA family protein [Paenibacillus sp. G2S3]WHY19015.1 GtrA family protein [Paenibacillus sp. G2S3]
MNLMGLIQSNIVKQFIKYAIVGVIGTAVQSLTLILLVEKMSANPLLGSVIGFIFSLIVSYFINVKWTFKTERRSSFFYKYMIVSISGLGINLLIMFLMVNLIGLWYIWAQMAIIIIVPISNFFLNRYWAFA